MIESGRRGRNHPPAARLGSDMAALRTLIAGNWKMNGLKADGIALARDLAARAAAGAPNCDLLVCPPTTLVAAISAEMLKDAGCTHVILGHSERRHGHGESDTEIRAKIGGAWRAGLVAILCVG